MKKCTIGLTTLFSLCCNSCDSPVSDQNAKNLKRIKEGMKVGQVRAIMGKPELIVTRPADSTAFGYMYDAPAGMSDNYYIYMSNSDSIVIGINDGL